MRFFSWYYTVLIAGLVVMLSSRLSRSFKQSLLPTISPNRKIDGLISSLKMVSTAPKRNILDQVGAAGIASAAVVAASAVNSAVGMRTLQAPSAEQTYVYRDGAAANRTGKVDEYGLPLIYDKDLIQAYWEKQGSALTRRWTEFLGYAVPFLTRIITIVVSGGTEELKNNGASLAKDAREIFEKLGPTYVKLGQMMSVRPDVLPQSALDELRILQDSVKPFDTPTAIKQIESELGGELGQFFTEISEKPVAAASLAQVYKARLASTGEFVAVKIQRPAVLDVVSKDLYVLRRAAEVYQGLMDRFAPQQRTNYVALLNEWAVGFYTELDFLNEAANQQRLKDLLISEKVSGMYVPKVHDELCTRRVLVSEWIDGKKLSECETAVLKDLIPDAQEAFLTQLLQVGFFHSDPHPGNILLMNEPRGDAKMALIDFGLVASIKQEDMDTMVSAIIHLANRDYANLVDDFIELGILPTDCDRPKVIPLMDKALTPYVKGGGAQKYEEELRKIYGMDGTMSGTAGGFQAMTQDALTVLNDIPFSIPPYFALLARAIVTLEGVALSANPNYGIIMESYPFVARKLLKEDRPEIQRALQQVLYSRGDGLQTTRLSVLLNSALGVVAKSSNVFVDLDSIPEDAVSIGTSLKFLMSKSAGSLRKILVEEAIGAGDILLRQTVRKSYSQILNNLPRPPLIGQFLPKPETVRVPFLVPRVTSGEVSLDNFSNLTPVFLTPVEFIDAASPKLSREEELYALSLTDIATQTLGRDAGIVANGNTLLEPSAAARLVLNIISSTDQLPGIPSQVPVKDISNRLLRPLLMAGGNARNPFQLLSTLLTSQGSVKIDESAKDKEGLGDLVDGINALTPEESAVFQETVNKIIGGLRERTVLRLQSVL